MPCEKLPKISGSDKHDISYTIEPTRIYKMHSEEFSIQAFDIEELKLDIKNVPSYESVNQCLISIAENFSIDIGNLDDEIEKFDKIANYLLMNKNLNLILLGECK